MKKKTSKKHLKIHKETMTRFHHANLYYIVMAVSLVLFIFFLVQGIRYHFEDAGLGLTISFYTMAILLLIIAKSSHSRGKGHYHYHGHLE